MVEVLSGFQLLLRNLEACFQLRTISVIESFQNRGSFQKANTLVKNPWLSSIIQTEIVIFYKIQSMDLKCSVPDSLTGKCCMHILFFNNWPSIRHVNTNAVFTDLNEYEHEKLHLRSTWDHSVFVGFMEFSFPYFVFVYCCLLFCLFFSFFFTKTLSIYYRIISFGVFRLILKFYLQNWKYINQERNHLIVSNAHSKAKDVRSFVFFVKRSIHILI